MGWVTGDDAGTAHPAVGFVVAVGRRWHEDDRAVRRVPGPSRRGSAPASSGRAQRRCRVSAQAPQASSQAEQVRSGTAAENGHSSGERSSGAKNIVVITGFEKFNTALYANAARTASKRLRDVNVRFFNDRDIALDSSSLRRSVQSADVLLVSLVFDYDQVQWLLREAEHVPTRIVFESALELMQMTSIGQFQMGGGQTTGSGSGGPPKAITGLLAKFGLKGREEDKMAGYLQMLKMGPKLLRLVPGGGMVKDFRDWLTVYAYWNAGSAANVAAMIWYITRELLQTELAPGSGTVPEPMPVPSMGIHHPYHREPFEDPNDYLRWYERWFPNRAHWPRVGLLLYRKHVVSELEYVDELIAHFEAQELLPIPFFINGVEAHIVVRDYFTTAHEQELSERDGTKRSARQRAAVVVSAVVSTIGFPLVGGPAGSMQGGRQVEVAQRILTSKNIPYLVAAPLITQDTASWRSSGVAGLQSVVLYSLPELDGAIDTVVLGGLVGDEIKLVGERLHRLTGRLRKWIRLQRLPRQETKVAIVLYSYPPGVGATGTAALLNVPESLHALLRALHAEGYDVGDALECSGEELLHRVRGASELFPGAEHPNWRQRLEDMATVNRGRLEQLLGVERSSSIEQQWGPKTGKAPINAVGDELIIGGLELGNVWIGIQPPLGPAPVDPMGLLFDREATPHPQYAAFYRWMEMELETDVCVHFGMHGSVEWLPGLALGNDEWSWPDVLLGDVPNLYLYAANNPSESVLAKRRGYGVIVSHNVPPYERAGLYRELATAKGLLHDYWNADPDARPSIFEQVRHVVDKSGLQAQFGLGDDPAESARALQRYLEELENRLFSSGLHVLGRPPQGAEALREYLRPLVEGVPGEEALLDAVCAEGSIDVDPGRFGVRDPDDVHRVNDAMEARALLRRTGEEVNSLLNGLRGGFIAPAPGGDVIRDGKRVLPTGRNIYSLDPYRLPSEAAFSAGVKVAELYIRQHRERNGGAYPETMAVPLWGLDNIKTRGESVGIVLGLIGATLKCDATGRTVRFELIPLDQLGRPRVDVLASMSGIFRDSFEHVVNLLDDMFRRAAAADEPEDMNFVRKHSRAMIESEDGIDEQAAGARLFSNASGEFGSLVNDAVTNGEWDDGEELGDIWKARNMFAYGRKDAGTERMGTLDALLSTTSGLLQEIDSVEYGLTDIQEYYANSGALLRAARTERVRDAGDPERAREVDAYFVEAFKSRGRDDEAEIKNLDALVDLEYRSKLLNPRWSDAMTRSGSGGAYEISQRFTALLGWSGTADLQADYVWNQSADMYVMDPEMANKLRKLNPEAYRNVVARLLEASARSMWSPEPEVMARLREEYESLDAELEGMRV